MRLDPALLNSAVPVAVCAALPFAAGGPWGAAWTLLALAALLSSVVAAVHYAEVIALRVGEPFGTLVLALAVTVIEASLIVALMLSGPEAGATLARDTVFATVMIICNGVVGLCLLLGAARHRVLAFRVDGTSPALSVLATMAVLVLVLPSFTSTTPGPTLSPSQLVFVAVVSLALYLMFVFVQTVRHREYFLPVEVDADGDGEPDAVLPQPSGRAVAFAVVLLVVALVAVVGLAKTLAPGIEVAVAAAGVPRATVGVVVAIIVLLPETWAAVRAARLNRMQTSFNLALGSALATIGLTIPVVAAIVLSAGLPLQLGLPEKEIVLLALTLLVASMTLSRGRATVAQGSVHLVLFAVFLFLTAVP